MRSRVLTLIVAVMAMGAMAACAPTRTQKTVGEQLDDSAVTAKVKTALARDPATSAFRIEVETFRGEVQLNGFVESQQAKARAAELAQAIDGVRAVENNLNVKM